jgi:hypothetical protein
MKILIDIKYLQGELDLQNGEWPSPSGIRRADDTIQMADRNYLRAITLAYAGLRLNECRCDVVIGDYSMFLAEELHIPAGFRSPGNE